MRGTRIVFWVLLAALGLGAVPAAADWWDDLDRGEAVRLRDVLADPERHRGRILTFFCVFHQRDQVFAPLLTPFHPNRHENLAVWPDGTPLWEEASFRADFPFLYVERSHSQFGDLLRLSEFTRIEVTGRIRAVLRGKPCIEILSFRETQHRLGDVVVKSIMRGDRYAETGDATLAYENYRRAMRPDLPPSYDLLVRQRLAASLRRLDRHEEAGQVEGGHILGGSQPPEARPRPPGGLLGDPLPGTPGVTPAPAGPGPNVGLPGQPYGDAPPLPGAAPPIVTGPDDLPGAPSGPSPISPALPGTPMGDPPPIVTEPSSSPAPVPPQPVPPQPVPPQPMPPQAVPAQPVPPQLVPPQPMPPGTASAESGPAESGSPDESAGPPSPPPLPAGAPPRRVPRLSGVK